MIASEWLAQAAERNLEWLRPLEGQPEHPNQWGFAFLLEDIPTDAVLEDIMKDVLKKTPLQGLSDDLVDEMVRLSRYSHISSLAD